MDIVIWALPIWQHDGSADMTAETFDLQVSQRLQGFVQQASTAGWRPLPLAAARAADLLQDVQSLVYDVLLDKASA